ncbi:MAG: dolichyl-phosphate beta-glucosyltransferase, partial [Thermoanaerobaculia bacterium]
APDGEAVDLSIVIPAYEEAGRLPASLEAISRYHRSLSRPLSLEVIVVDDGSTDGTSAAAENAARALGLPCRVISLARNQGKGSAVRAGVLGARGTHVLVSDADFSTPIAEWEKLCAAGSPVAIGSRAVAGSRITQKQPLFRVLSGRLFNRCVRAFVISGIADTQCGFKLFTRAAARDVFTRTRVDRFAYDVESLLIAQRLGYAIAEVPVLWINSPDSRVSLGGGLQAFVELLRIRSRVDRALRAETPRG